MGNEKYLNGSFLLVQTSCEELCRCYLSGCCTLLFNNVGKGKLSKQEAFRNAYSHSVYQRQGRRPSMGCQALPVRRGAYPPGFGRGNKRGHWGGWVKKSHLLERVGPGTVTVMTQVMGALPFLLVSSPPATCQFLKYFGAAIDNLVCIKCDLHR